MSITLEVGQRVRHTTKNFVGTVVSVDEPIEGTAQTVAPNVTYTVDWNDNQSPESLIYPKELEAID